MGLLLMSAGSVANKSLQLRQLGLADYELVWRAMQDFTDRRDENTVDELWLVQHPPVFTQGQTGKDEHILSSGDIPVVLADRGGQVTYHGPGQIVAYLMVDIRRAGVGVREFVEHIEESIIRVLEQYGVKGQRSKGAPGVYVGAEKIASVGLRVRRGRSFHGLAFNIDMDLEPFKRIHPCGYEGLVVTQLKAFSPLVFSEAEDRLVDSIALILGYTEVIGPVTVEDSSKEIDLNKEGKMADDVAVRAGVVKQLGAEKMARNTASFTADAPQLRKPPWIRVRLPAGNAVADLKSKLRNRQLITVCEEATCPNIHECFSKGTATFMILGEVCTRRCSFCDVAHGRPLLPDENEPRRLARVIGDMKLKYVVITSVDRDDLRDGGAGHFARCIDRIREVSPGVRVEILVPDFRGKGKIDRALNILSASPPDVFNHNLETVESLYRNVRPGADYQWSLDLLAKFKRQHPDIPTKSGIMLGLGENREQVEKCLRDLCDHKVDMITIGQYLQPTAHHHPVMRYWTPKEFESLAEYGYGLGFMHMACGPLVRSSYHADLMAKESGLVKRSSEQ